MTEINYPFVTMLMNTENTPPMTRAQRKSAAAAAAAAALNVNDAAAATIIAAKRAEEENAAAASAAAGQSPDQSTEAGAPPENQDNCPGFVSRPGTKEKRKVDWRANAPALYSLCAALPRDVASAREQIAAGKFDPTARRARFDVPKMESYARELPVGSMEREGLFFLIQSAYRSASLNDIPRRECRSGTLTLFSETGGVTGSRKGYTPHDS